MTEKIKLTLTAAHPLISLQVAKTPSVLLEVASVIVGKPGEKGPPGDAADADIATDPTAYYILARS